MALALRVDGTTQDEVKVLELTSRNFVREIHGWMEQDLIPRCLGWFLIDFFKTEWIERTTPPQVPAKVEPLIRRHFDRFRLDGELQETAILNPWSKGDRRDPREPTRMIIFEVNELAEEAREAEEA